MDIISKWFRTSVTKQHLKQQNSVLQKKGINRIENRLLDISPKLNQEKEEKIN